MDQNETCCNIYMKTKSDGLNSKISNHCQEAKTVETYKSRNKEDAEHRADDRASKLKELQHMLSVLKLDVSSRTEESKTNTNDSALKMLEQQAGIANDCLLSRDNIYAGKQRLFNPKPIRGKRNIPLTMSKTESTTISDSDSVSELQSEINDRLDAIEEIKCILNESYSCPSINHSKIMRFERPACIPRSIGSIKTRKHQTIENNAFSYTEESTNNSFLNISKSDLDKGEN